jgi:hypothetical protein
MSLKMASLLCCVYRIVSYGTPKKTIWIGGLFPPICSLLQHPWTGTPNHMFVQCSCQILTGYDASVENFGDKAPNPVDSRVLLQVLTTSDRFPLVITSSWSSPELIALILPHFWATIPHRNTGQKMCGWYPSASFVGYPWISCNMHP